MNPKKELLWGLLGHMGSKLGLNALGRESQKGVSLGLACWWMELDLGCRACLELDS